LPSRLRLASVYRIGGARMRNLREFALSRLRACFPKDFHRIVSELSQRELAKNAPQPAVAESKAAAQAVASARCATRGCPFPALFDNLCRGHFLDAHADRSLMPSLTGEAVTNLNRLIA
jgi:hypothetical protein